MKARSGGGQQSDCSGDFTPPEAPTTDLPSSPTAPVGSSPALRLQGAFRARYEAAVSVLQGLWEEGRVLAATLRAEVPMPLPVRVATSPIDGSTRAAPVRSGEAAPAVDAEASRLGAHLDKLDEALSLCNAIRQGGELEARHHQLAIGRGTASGYTGVYRVMLPFQCMQDGLEFQSGQLVDHTLIGSGMLHRLMTGTHFIQPLSLTSAA